MYLKFFKERPDIKSVIHCHAPNVCAFSILDEDYLMKPYFPETTHEVGPKCPVLALARATMPLSRNNTDILYTTTKQKNFTTIRKMHKNGTM